MLRLRLRRRPRIALSCAALLGFLALGGGGAPATFAGTYSHDGTTGQTNPDWMAKVPDSRKLRELSIPGTHDSGSSVSGGDIALTQSMSIENQLKAGVRGFDIRLGQDIVKAQVGVLPITLCGGPDLWVVHGTLTCQEQRFTTVLQTMAKFLAAHPREVLLVRIKKDADHPSDSDFLSKVEKQLDEAGALIHQRRADDPSVLDLTLGRTRGTIVVLRDYTGGSGGIPWGMLSAQDAYSLASVWELALKWWLAGTKFIDAGNVSRSGFHVNFLSASGGGFPYFFASGNSSPSTDAPALWTGWSRGIIDSCRSDPRCIAEYPCVDVLGTCYVNFKGMNSLATDLLNQRREIKRTGIVFADFPGADLISAVIAVNARLGLAQVIKPLGLADFVDVANAGTCPRPRLQPHGALTRIVVQKDGKSYVNHTGADTDEPITVTRNGANKLSLEVQVTLADGGRLSRTTVYDRCGPRGRGVTR